MSEPSDCRCGEVLYTCACGNTGCRGYDDCPDLDRDAVGIEGAFYCGVCADDTILDCDCTPYGPGCFHGSVTPREMAENS